MDDLVVFIKSDLEEHELILGELYMQIVPPVYISYMILFICVLKSEEGPNAHEFKKSVQKLAEKVHSMGLSQSPAYCSMMTIKKAYSFCKREGFIVEQPHLVNKKIVPAYRLEEGPRFKSMVKELRNSHNWVDNYKLVKRVFLAEVGARKPDKDRQRL